jgi:hypothetical protein
MSIPSEARHDGLRANHRIELSEVQRQPDAQSPAGGVSSTVRDMGRWLRLQLAGGKFDGKQIVDEDALAETHVPQSESGAPATPTSVAGFYGLGWNVSYDDQGRVHLSHSGAFALGAGTVVATVPSEQLGIVVLSNGEPIGVSEAISDTFLDLGLRGKVQQDWLAARQAQFKAALHPAPAHDYSKAPANPAPAQANSTYVGIYDSAYYGPIEITQAGDGLSMALGPNQEPFALRHWDGDEFIYQPTGEEAAGPSAVTFVVGADRQADNVVIEYLDANHLGTFTRASAPGR